MKDVTSDNFGLLIAYVLPGFTVLWGLSFVSTTVQSWIGATDLDSPTIAGFLYVTVASVGLGMTVNAMRWLVIDRIHHQTGIRPPEWDFSRLGERVAAFQVVVDHQYRHYQFYATSVLALPIAQLFRWSAIGFRLLEFIVTLSLVALFFAGSRDTLRKYYSRISGLFRDSTDSQERLVQIGAL
ncbi:MAG: hypothetical protein KDA80_20990 [Planctomycetaceae bacterium]|nr:hypothetical protein [Planctomycetaceae bacterium]